METTTKREPMARDEAIARIRKALKARSGKQWSVTGGRGTAYGWITIDVPPARKVDGIATETERAELAALLGIPSAHYVSVGASSDYRWEYVDRAEGRTPKKIAEPYWD